MDDSRAVELFSQFRGHYQQKKLLTIVQEPNFSGEQAMAAAMMPFMESASDFLRELFNSVNNFRRWVNTLDAWRRVYDGCEDGERLSLLVEHIYPYATLTLSGPQAIRGRIMHAAAVCCCHANFVTHSQNLNLQWDSTGHLSMKVASRIGQPWASWKALAPLLGQKLGYGAVHDLTDDFRNQYEHGHPRNIALGLTASVLVGKGDAGQRSWSIGVRDAISIDTVIKQAIEQHALMVDAYSLFCALAKEQFEALMEVTHPLLPQ